MIEKHASLSTQPPVHHNHPIAGTWATPSKPLVKTEPESIEDEPYTIKCICNVSEDDGNTIYCENCETWQHIDCFYPDNREEALNENFAHSCEDCKPRILDHERAVERMKKFRAGILEEDEEESARHGKKTKRQMSKTSKKKPKPGDILLVNGSNTSSGSEVLKPSSTAAAVDSHFNNHQTHHHNHKKSKSSHKISSQQPPSTHFDKHSPSYAKLPSPASTPPDLPADFELHNYSTGLLSLYESDLQVVQNNSFADIETSRTMTNWLRDPKTLLSQTNQHFKDVFQPSLASSISRNKDIYVGQMKSLTVRATDLRIQYLATRAPIAKDSPIIELNGQVGLQISYCQAAHNNWGELCTPLPFVFFHPLLPLYIDTRKEGSDARYVRRSCKPNTTLETYLSGSQYHFWLVSDRYIGADEQITLPWDFRLPKEVLSRVLTLLGLNDDASSRQQEPEMDAAEYQNHAAWLYRVLTEYGGCACDLGDNCAFKRFHRNFLAKTMQRSSINPSSTLQVITNAATSSTTAASASTPATNSIPPKKKAARKSKSHVVSPTSIVPLADSRASSEVRLDDPITIATIADSDIRSTLAPGVRSKASSRERSPTRPIASFDQTGILTEPTDRDKRKVAMLEDTFRRMEQQPPKKKKRVTSDGSQSSAISKASKARSEKSSSNVTYSDAGTMSGKSPSPASAAFPAPSRHSTSRQTSAVPHSRQTSLAPSLVAIQSTTSYTDASTQTDPNEDDFFALPPPPPSRPIRRVVSLAQRLLNARKSQLAETARRASFSGGSVGMLSTSSINTNSTRQKRLSEASNLAISEDHLTIDIPNQPPRISDSAVCNIDAQENAVAQRPVDLRVQFPPPLLTGPNTLGVPSTTTTVPLSATSLVQSPFASSLHNPFGGAVSPVNPSPVKKKLSLSDYTKSRANKSAAAAASHKTIPASKLASADEAIGEEAIMAHREEGSSLSNAGVVSVMSSTAAASSVSENT
ncbi:SET domain-containing protein 3 [Ceratocystis pirilliformis]|uniref:SET domain-containing protein 3 n=1 Tax=Ceratocystis pirilliformis TaxID=259994 RepID=A0ABR3ZND6_9PEZI